MPITAIGPQEMKRIFEVTDSLGIHRENIRVPLRKKDPGSVTKDLRGVYEVQVPESIPFDEWISSLQERLKSLGILV